MRSRTAPRPLAALLLLAAAAPAARADDGAAADPHAHHHQMMMEMGEHHHEMRRATRTTADYAVPDVRLVREDGKAVTLKDELADGKPVVLEFIYTSCTTICPVMTQNLSQLQARLGAERDRVHLVSISIDPEQDTPARLADYAQRFHAQPGWHLYTGTAEASVAAQRAFDAFRGDKMNHTPATFLRAAPGARWVRLDGFASADELARELHGLVAARG